MNGRPILSCMTLAIECNGKEIETVEGIAAAGHPLVEAYVKHHCMQCGYCTPGFVATAKALLDRNLRPTEQEIREALGGNLCRCGTYPQHPKAILEAARILREAGKP
jgi:aerobic-type carbon monoxide dehydrogenase small subunit (CoxS/CutS family)